MAIFFNHLPSQGAYDAQLRPRIPLPLSILLFLPKQSEIIHENRERPTSGQVNQQGLIISTSRTQHLRLKQQKQMEPLHAYVKRQALSKAKVISLMHLPGTFPVAALKVPCFRNPHLCPRQMEIG